MKLTTLILLTALSGAVPALVSATPRPIVDFSTVGSEMLAVPSEGDQVTVSRVNGSSLQIDIAPGSLNYPGITFTFARDTLALGDCGYVELALTNTGERTISLSIRVDSLPDDERPKGRSVGTAYLKAGESGTARAYFVRPSKGYGPVVPERIYQILIFTAKATSAHAFRIDSLTAGGDPGEAPEQK